MKDRKNIKAMKIEVDKEILSRIKITDKDIEEISNKIKGKASKKFLK